METKCITVIDKTTKPDDGHNRKTTLAWQADKPMELGVVGVLPHGTIITFDKHNARLMIEFLSQFV